MNGLKYQICISAAARGKSVEHGRELAEQMGRAIALTGHTLLTGATVGLPYLAAKAARAAGGQSVGLSPAASRIEHAHTYRLPDDAYDVLLFTGLNYVGRDSLLINCADAMIIIGGRLGTTHEFTIAMETGKPVAILRGAGGTSQLFDELMHAAGRSTRYIVEETDPKILLSKLTDILDEKHEPMSKTKIRKVKVD